MVKFNSFWVDEPRTNRTVCYNCHRNILKTDIRVKIRVMYHFEYYHLLCYKPKYKQFIGIKKLTIVLDDFSKKILSDWIENWNSPYKNPKDLDIRPYKLKTLKTTFKCENLAIWVEILKFLDPIDVAKNISRVSRALYRASSEKSLWIYFNIKYFSNDSQAKNYKEMFISYYFEACMKCRKISEKKISRCLATQRRFCSNCLGIITFYHKTDIKSIYGVNPNKLGVPFIPEEYGQKLAYKHMVKRAVYNYRSKRKEKVIKRLKNVLREEVWVLKALDMINIENKDIKNSLDAFKNHKLDCENSKVWLSKVADYINRSNKKITLTSICQELLLLFKID
ncbi:hypothetical protein SteCoe_3128 [Stentor coeruleus]|uniref:PARP-type domain-containing protein n=1 Tax=Stentor coeruleus TaxID=5963 RepID=A0A1R2CXR5_9CILI|nr:hypothetical protein SteCoe_3128 [Stentor coeruleus]